MRLIITLSFSRLGVGVRVVIVTPRTRSFYRPLDVWYSTVRTHYGWSFPIRISYGIWL
jgi:hypothetical protein